MYAFSSRPLWECRPVEAYARIARDYLVTGEGVIATPGPYDGAMWYVPWMHALQTQYGVEDVVIPRHEAMVLELPRSLGMYPCAFRVVVNEDAHGAVGVRFGYPVVAV